MNQQTKNSIRSNPVDWNFWRAEKLAGCRPRTIERKLTEMLKLLHRIGLELARTESVDELFCKAMELGQSQLGFDRMSAWMLNDEPDVARGYYSINEAGVLTDCRDEYWTYAPDIPLRKVLQDGSLFFEDYEERDGEKVHKGTYAFAAITTAGKVIGFIVSDIFSDLPPSLARALRLYGDLVGRHYARLQMKAELKARHDLTHLIMSNINDAVWMMDKEKTTYLSPSAVKKSGFSLEQALNLSLSDRLTPASLKKWRRLEKSEIRLILNADCPVPHKSWLLQQQLNRADGTSYPVEINVSLLRDKNNFPIGLLGVSRDLTEQKKAEKAQAENEIRFCTFFEQSPIPIELFDADGLLTDLNPAALEFSGYNVEKLINRYSIFTDTFIPKNILERAMEGKESREVVEVDYANITDGHFHFAKKAAIKKYFDTTLTPLKREGEERPYAYLMQYQDMTEAREAEQSLQESERKIRFFIEQLPAFTYSTNMYGHSPFLYTSPQVEDLLGYTAEEWDSDPSIFFSQIHPDDRQMVLDKLNEAQKNNSPYAMEYRIYTRDGRLIWARDQASFIRDAEGDAQYIFGLMLDITDRKQAEMHQAQIRQFRDKERIRTEFLSLTSHELRTPLTPIRGAIDMLEDCLSGPLTAEQKRLIETADRHTEHLQRLVNDLLDIFRLESGRLPLRKTPVALDNIIKESISSFSQRYMEKGLSMKFIADAGLPEVNCDPKRIRQVLDNLLYNRLLYNEKGSVIISLAREENNLLIKLADAGIVVPPERATAIFQRFHPLDSEGEIAGLGFALIKQLVEAHGGAISFESEAGKGSAFNIRLPLE